MGLINENPFYHHGIMVSHFSPLFTMKLPFKGYTQNQGQKPFERFGSWFLGPEPVGPATGLVPSLTSM